MEELQQIRQGNIRVVCVSQLFELLWTVIGDTVQRRVKTNRFKLISVLPAVLLAQGGTCLELAVT